eukprot:CAMPEP_0177711062 /NCGR_PEP_ID=MMETSP0484_2-20121128/11659_1 /TAXON_ID=354590 /ORGANISM="Rhodomonas lens, Strain RHODO" /LENGTH=410 /DNA_ID=CAMNT_0019222767 /DNA_START=166 /DNA_END=1399 /DNA_ORIENTATION=+
MDQAATIIQRAWRGLERVDKRYLRNGALSKVHQWFLGSPVIASEKLDGTNVGKMRCGTLLGRRQAIADSATEYQHCSLRVVRESNTDAVLDELVATLASDNDGVVAAVQRSAIYGELCCNPGLYHYQKTNLARTWQPFGAIVQFQSVESAQQAFEGGTAAGLTCVFSAEAKTVRVCNSPHFAALLRKHEVAVIESRTWASLVDFVKEKKEWMCSESGEGMVVSVNTKTAKWKISREPQTNAVQELRTLTKSLKPGGAEAHKAALLAPAILQLLDDLYEVATHVDSGGGGKKGGKVGGDGKKGRVTNADNVLAAIASALTKFDSLSVSFAEKGKDALGALFNQITDEVMGDEDLGLPAEGPERVQAEKEVGIQVKRFVSEQYGAWLRADQAASSASRASQVNFEFGIPLPT